MLEVLGMMGTLDVVIPVKVLEMVRMLEALGTPYVAGMLEAPRALDSRAGEPQSAAQRKVTGALRKMYGFQAWRTNLRNYVQPNGVPSAQRLVLGTQRLVRSTESLVLRAWYIVPSAQR
jgi:hypothetical protein